MDKELVLYVRLEGDEVDSFEQGKALSGLRTNTEYVRFLIKSYVADKK
jgi:hypothetical protein